MHTMTLVVLVLLSLGFTQVPARVSAQAARPRQTLESSLSGLRDPNPEIIEESIQTIALRGSPRAIETLATRIREGLPRQLAITAVEALGVLGNPSAGPILTRMARHRNPDIRRAAVSALVECQPRDVESTLLVALGDPDSQVRSLAALGLGHVGSQRAIEPLFAALDHHDSDAATALGALARGESVTRLTGYLGHLALDVLAPALRTLLVRPDIDEGTKRELLRALGELATPTIREFLIGIRDDHEHGLPNGSQTLRAALEQTLHQIDTAEQP